MDFSKTRRGFCSGLQAHNRVGVHSKCSNQRWICGIWDKSQLVIHTRWFPASSPNRISNGQQVLFSRSLSLTNFDWFPRFTVSGVSFSFQSFFLGPFILIGMHLPRCYLLNKMWSQFGRLIWLVVPHGNYFVTSRGKFRCIANLAIKNLLTTDGICFVQHVLQSHL